MNLIVFVPFITGANPIEILWFSRTIFIVPPIVSLQQRRLIVESLFIFSHSIRGLFEIHFLLYGLGGRGLYNLRHDISEICQSP